MATANAERRLLKDLQKIQEDTVNDTIMAMPDENTVFEWTAVIMGAEDTDWEGACLKLRMKFADTYPNKAPEIKFVTKMFHPNIYKDGRICLDILNEKWTPSYSVHTILTSI